jgi:MYXO-CTERM domain-containing protein
MRSSLALRGAPLALVLAASSLVVASTSAFAAEPTRAPVARTSDPTAAWIHFGGRYVGPPHVSDEVRAKSILSSLTKRSDVSSMLVSTGSDRFGDGDTIVRFEQAHKGLPVIGRGATVRLSKAGQPITSAIDLETTLPDPTPTLSANDAAKVVNGTGARFGSSSKDAHLIVWPTFDRGARLAYAVLPDVPAAFGSAPRYIVDAQTGEILQARDMVVFAKAKMYEFNPTKTPSTVDHDLSMAPTGTKLTNPFIEATNCIDNKTVKPVNFSGFNLTVHICDLVQVATANTGGNFMYEPSDETGSLDARKDPFAEVSLYYHTAKAYAFFRQLQGEADAQVVVDKPLKLIANLQIPAGLTSGDIATAADPNTPLETFQNAFFSPKEGGLGALFQQLYGFKSGALWFGQGPKRDYSYDGDVVYHEFGHAVVDKTLKLGAWHVDARGAVDAPGAMNEGLADYFSSAITGDPDVGEYAALDIGSDGKVIRTLDNKDTCTNAVIGEVHYDSTVFSGGLWTARQSLGAAERPKFDAAIYKAMRTNPGRGDLGYEDLGKLLKATLDTDLPAGAAALDKALTDRGLFPACERIHSFEGAPITSIEKRIGFAAPGSQTVPALKGVAPGILQVKAALPANTKSVTVTFAARAGGGGGAANPLGGSAKPFAPVVLAKLGAPITWTTKGHDAEIKSPAAKAEAATTVTLEIPEGTTADSIYVQITNAGESDGAYDNVALSFTPGEPVDPGAGAPPPAPVTTTRTEDGCAVASTAPSQNTSSVGAGILAAALALIAGRRRKR